MAITKSNLSSSAAFIFLLVNLCFLVWYLFVGYMADFHSDSAAKVLIAREIVATGDYFPDDWNYVNSDLFVLFGHSFIIPLLAFLPAGFTVHALSGLFSSMLVLSSIWFVTGLAPLITAHRILIVATLAAGISGFLAENLFGQVSYGSIVYFSCFILYFSWKVIEIEKNRVWLWGLPLFVVIVLIFWANPQRGLVFYAIPIFIATLFLLAKPDTAGANRKRTGLFVLLGILFVGIMQGSYLHVQTILGVNNHLGAGHARWLPYDLMVRNVGLMLKGFLAIFGGLPTPEVTVVSKAGIYEAARFSAALTLLVLIPITVFQTLKRKEPGLVFLCVYALALLAVVVFLQSTTTIPDMSDPIQSSRYLIPPLLLMLLLILMQPVDFASSPLVVIFTALSGALLLTSSFPALVSSGTNSQYISGMLGQRGSQHQAVSKFLVDNGLRYGYATYWNAAVNSVLSNERVLVRQIVLDKGIPMPMRHLSSDRWYQPKAWKRETFLLLKGQESNLLDLELLAYFNLQPVRELVFQDYRIYVFSENISKNLPGWDASFEEALTIPANKHSFHQIGEFVQDINRSASALVAERGTIGALHFGPYLGMKPGRYRITFDVISDHHPDGVIRLDVSSAPDQKLFGNKILLSSDRPQEIVFSLDETRVMEFRVWALGNERVVFRGVSIKRLPEAM